VVGHTLAKIGHSPGAAYLAVLRRVTPQIMDTQQPLVLGALGTSDNFPNRTTAERRGLARQPFSAAIAAPERRRAAIRATCFRALESVWWLWRCSIVIYTGTTQETQMEDYGMR
jgi:hypothetical protein